ncbi:MAG: hypothetical protein N3D82_02720 [Ignisphaera sp.]|nr:hypothetical protein [Ignisphaera sp.]MCX8167932.1 hypothetical protein [Ignisphaera sp.]MDW8086161.1 hypothetical protein [Ignisphaera sp.]
MSGSVSLQDFTDEVGGSGGSVEWVCRCGLCRLLALPVFRKVSGYRGGDDEQQGGSVEELSEAPPESIQQSASGVGVSTQSVDVDSIVSRVVDEVDKRVSSRIDGIERELEGVKSSFGGVAEELRSAIIEVRSAVSELANPFNFMRKYAEIVDDGGKLLQLLAQQSGQQSTPLQQVLAPVASQLPLSDDVKMLLSSVLAQQKSGSTSPHQSSFAKVLKLIKWVDEHLVGVPREVVEELTAFVVGSGLISEREKNLLLSAIGFVESMRKRGIRIREQLIMLYTVVKMLGVEDREADSEIMKIILEESKRGHPGGDKNGF